MALNKTENISVKTEVFSRELDYHSHLSIGITLTLSTCFGLIMNVMIIYVFIRKSKLRTQTNWLVFAIVSTDLIIICFGIPMAVVSSFYNRWVFGTWGCKYYAFLMSFTGFVEITLLTLISICRYIVIVKSHLKHLITQKVVLTLICGSTLYSLMWAVLPLIGWSSYDVEATYTTCSVNWRRKDLNHISFSFSAMTFNLFIPFTIILYCYIGIFRKNKRDRLQRRWRFARQNSIRTSRVEGEITKTIVYMIIAFVFSWFPYAIVCLWSVLGDPLEIPAVVAIIPTIMTKLSILWNPIIYVARNKDFRKAIRDHLSCLAVKIVYDKSTYTMHELKVKPPEEEMTGRRIGGANSEDLVPLNSAEQLAAQVEIDERVFAEKQIEEIL